jgi:hypothetical protein
VLRIFHLRHLLPKSLPVKKDRNGAVVKNEIKLRGGQSYIKGHKHSTDFCRGKIGFEKLIAVKHEKAHPIARFYTETEQGIRHSVGTLVELPVGEKTILKKQSLSIRGEESPLSQYLADNHGIFSS